MTLTRLALPSVCATLVCAGPALAQTAATTEAYRDQARAELVD